jgi:hypothetical protein
MKRCIIKLEISRRYQEITGENKNKVDEIWETFWTDEL